MPQNYDTTTGKPFPRITNVDMTYPLPPGIPVLTYTEVQCCITADGVQHILQGTENKFSIAMDPAQAKTPVQMVSPSTGADLPGATTSYTGLMMSILAITRADQKSRDAAAAAAAAAGAGA